MGGKTSVPGTKKSRVWEIRTTRVQSTGTLRLTKIGGVVFSPSRVSSCAFPTRDCAPLARLASDSGPWDIANLYTTPRGLVRVFKFFSFSHAGLASGLGFDVIFPVGD